MAHKSSFSELRDSFAYWGSIENIELRHDLLIQLKQEMLSRSEDIIQAEVLDVRKTTQEAREDFLYALSHLDHSIDCIHQVSKNNELTCNQGLKNVSRFDPVGLVLMITPWNFPLVVAFERLPYMLAAGCTVLWKPSEYAYRSALIVESIIKKLSPYVILRVIVGDGKLGKTLIDMRPDLISFTGSTRVGKEIQLNPKIWDVPKSLELGGKNFALVDKTADLNIASKSIAESFLRNCGQACIQISAVLIHEQVYESFKYNLIQLIRTMSALSPQRLSEPSRKNNINGIITELSTISACCLNGSFEFPFMSPFIFESLSLKSKLWYQEFFSLVLLIDKYSNLDNSIDFINKSPYGLASALYSQDTMVINKYMSDIRAGRVWINTEQISWPQVRIGGCKASGSSKINGLSPLSDYCFQKSFVMPSNLPI